MSRVHGNAATYRAGCRCDDCREANRVRSAAEQKRRAAAPRDQVPHGTYGGYINWSCRCPGCTAAHTAAKAAQRRRKAALQLREGAVVIAVILGVTAGMCGTFAGIEAHRHFTRPPAVQLAPAPRANPSPVLTSTGGAR